MADYRRPDIAQEVFSDADGAPIPYGERWSRSSGGSPPEDSYSVTGNLERFAPLHAVADALIAHLAAEYAVGVEEGPEHARELLHPFPDEEVVRAVKLTPRDQTAAPVTFVFTAFPGLALRFGVLQESHFPSCGCDACDETWQDQADELEWRVFAAVDGGFSERVSEPRRARLHLSRKPLGLVRDMGQTVEYAFTALDGSRSESGAGRAADLPPSMLRAAMAALDALASETGGAWRPWPRRASAHPAPAPLSHGPRIFGP